MVAQTHTCHKYWYHLILVLVLALANESMGSSSVQCPAESSSYYYFSISLPSGCTGSTCIHTVRLGQNTQNNSFLDVSIETRRSGYGTVGFSTNTKMPDTDVLGCGRDSTGVLQVRDTWNPSYYNEDDPNQDGVCVYSMSYDNGVIKCSFSRFVGILNPGYDYDLNDSYYLLLAYSDNQDSNSNFPEHSLSLLPSITSGKVTFFALGSNSTNGSSTITNDGKLRQSLIRVHGVFMLVAWSFLAVIGIFFAAWTKPSFPKGQWFQFHRILMISSVIVAAVGFTVVFIANKDNSIPGLIEFNSCPRKITHFALGIAVTFFQMLNPLIAFCRCKPTSNRRFIFNLIHGSAIGLFTEILALVNVGLGIALFQSNCSKLLDNTNNHILWVYIAWVAFFGAVLVFLFVFTIVSAFKNQDVDLAPSVLKPFLKFFFDDAKDQIEVKEEMENLSGTDYQSLKEGHDEVPKKLKDSNIRSGTLGIFCVTTLTFIVVLVVMLSIDGGSDS